MGDIKRHVVGEADPATRRRLLALALRPGPPVKPALKKATSADTSASVLEAAAQLARRGHSVDAAVDDTAEYRNRQNQIAALRGRMK